MEECGRYGFAITLPVLLVLILGLFSTTNVLETM
jgi:Flp pilus assembly protein TadG